MLFRCKIGQVFTPSGCRKIDLCLFSPCLNGGTCHKTDKGFSCFCPTGFSGKYCEWSPYSGQNQGLSTILALAIAASAVVFRKYIFLQLVQPSSSLSTLFFFFQIYRIKCILLIQKLQKKYMQIIYIYSTIYKPKFQFTI